MNWKIVLIILSCNVLFMSASYTMLIPFLPMYLVRELGVAEEDVSLWSGVVFSSTFIVSAVMAPIWGRMADKHGKRSMAIRAALLLSASYFLGGIVTSPEQLTMMRIFQGFAAGLWPMALAIMTLYAPKEKLGFSLGVMQGALMGGNVLGPLFGGGFAELFGMRLSFFAASFFLLVNALFFIFVIKEPPEPAEEKKEKASAGSLWHRPLIRHMLIYAVFVQMVILLIQPILTTYVAELAGNLPNLIFISGLVFSLGGFASVIAAPLWGKLGQSKGFMRTFLLSLVGAGVLFLLQGLPRSLYIFAVLQFAIGLFFAGIHPSINALLASHTPAELKGSIFGVLFSAQQMGCIIGPLLGGTVATLFGESYVFYTAGFLLLAIAAVACRQEAGGEGIHMPHSFFPHF